MENTEQAIEEFLEARGLSKRDDIEEAAKTMATLQD